MYNVVLDHVFKHFMLAMRLETWEDHLPSFTNVLRTRGCPEGHCFGFIDGTMFTICKPTYGQEAMSNGWKRQHVAFRDVRVPWYMTKNGGSWKTEVSGVFVRKEEPTTRVRTKEK